MLRLVQSNRIQIIVHGFYPDTLLCQFKYFVSVHLLNKAYNLNVAKALAVNLKMNNPGNLFSACFNSFFIIIMAKALCFVQ